MFSAIQSSARQYPLTFTIGWLKLFISFNVEINALTLTFTIGWLKPNLFVIAVRSAESFNFHHRVVETSNHSPLCRDCLSLTFTIGWLKRKSRFFPASYDEL